MTEQAKEYVDLIITAQICSEPEIIQYGDKQKLVFEIEGKTGQKLTCVTWEKYDVQAGDLITIKGRLHFKTKHIVLFKNSRTSKSLLIIRKADKNETKEG